MFCVGDGTLLGISQRLCPQMGAMNITANGTQYPLQPAPLNGLDSITFHYSIYHSSGKVLITYYFSHFFPDLLNLTAVTFALFGCLFATE